MSRLSKVFVPTFALVLILSLVSYFIHSNTIELLESRKLVFHTYDVLLLSEKTQQDLGDAETEYFFYVITKDKTHLRDYNQARGRAQVNYDLLVESTHDNPVQQENLARLKEAMNRRSDYIQSVFDKVRTNQPTPEVGTPPCVEMRKDVQNCFNKVSTEEKTLLERRQADNSATLVRFISMTIFLAMMVSTSVAFIIGVLYSDLQRKKNMDDFMTSMKR
jgi:CHASE3 domain sensor protein